MMQANRVDRPLDLTLGRDRLSALETEIGVTADQLPETWLSASSVTATLLLRSCSWPERSRCKLGRLAGVIRTRQTHLLASR
jgi:hypothetical protein